MTNPTTPFNWQMPQSTDLVTDLPADFETFGQAVATSMADLLGGTTGQVLSKASNTDMDFTWVAQDDSNAIQNAIVDAKGDLIAASAADTPARLAVGNNGETLIADSTAATGLKWAKSPNFVGTSIYRNSTQSIPNNTFTACTFDAEYFDTNGFHSTSTDTSRITIPTGLSGKYQININCTWDANATGIRQLSVYKNGLNFFSTSELAGVSGVYVGQNGGFVMELSAGDYIEIRAYQSSGGNLPIYLRGQDEPFNVTYLGA